MHLKWIVIGRQEWVARLARAAWKGLAGIEVTLVHAPDAGLAAVRLQSHPDVDWIFCPSFEAERLVATPQFQDAFDRRLAEGHSMVVHGLDEPSGANGEGISLNGAWVPWSELGMVLGEEYAARFNASLPAAQAVAH